jgi:hypothetical protein
VKGWDTQPIEKGMYNMDPATMRAYSKPCLPMADAAWFARGREVLQDGTQMLEAWTTIFCHLCIKGQDVEPVRLEGEEIWEDKGLSLTMFCYGHEDAGMAGV